MSSLLNMPDVVMKKIMGECDFVSIEILRKTCHDLRNFIDDTKPEQFIREIQIFGYTDFIDMHLIIGEKTDKTYPKGHVIFLRFEKKHGEDTCKITWYRSENSLVKELENEHFENIFLQNFKNILNLKISILHKFIFMGPLNPEVLKGIGSALKSRSTLLQAEEIRLIGDDQNEILEILPYICPKSLKKLEIQGNICMEEPMRIDEIMNLEQWKKAEDLDFRWFTVIAEARNFEHFNTVEASLLAISLDFLKVLKETFLTTSSTTKYFKFSSESESTPGKQELIEFFGALSSETEEDGKEKWTWFFEHSDDSVLQITVVSSCSVELKIVPKSEIFHGVRILE